MTTYNFIFTKKSPGKYYRHIVFWIAQYLFWTFWATGFFIGLAETLKFGLRFNGGFIIHAAYTYLIVYYFSPRYLETKKYKNFLQKREILFNYSRKIHTEKSYFILSDIVHNI